MRRGVSHPQWLGGGPSAPGARFGPTAEGEDLFPAVQAQALQCCFLASSPEAGVNGLYFADFASEPAWMQTTLEYDEHQLAEQVYDASRALTDAPASAFEGFLSASRRLALSTEPKPLTRAPPAGRGAAAG